MEKMQINQPNKKQRRRILSWAAVFAVVCLLAAMPLLAKSKGADSGDQASILSASAEFQNVDTQIIGGGQLASESSIRVKLPEEVKITEYLVGNGDTVSAGEPIAAVDKVSVMTAITGVQETLDYLSEKIAVASDEGASDTVKALAGGTVKEIYAKKGESVQNVMLEHGALAVLSLDDTMAVRLEVDCGLRPGDTVCVTLTSGKEVDGRVKSNQNGVLIVTIADEDYAVGAQVTVETADGQRLGAGELYVFSPWNATAYSGTVSDILVSEGDTVYVGQTMMKLSDPGNSAEFQRLIDQRQEYEELMQELFVMYQSGSIAAPCDGIITGVDKNGTFLLSNGDEGWFVDLLTYDTDTADAAFVVCTANIAEDTEQTEAFPQPEQNNPAPPVQASGTGLGDEDSNDGELSLPAANGNSEPGEDDKGNPCTGQADCTAVTHNPGCLSQQTTPPPANTVSITTTALNPGVVGQSYTSPLQASDGENDLTGTWAASGLPGGLSIDPATGIISGIPTAAGSYAVTVSFTYNDTPVAKNFTLVITEAAAQTVYRGYVAQIVEIIDGAAKVKQTAYSYAITDLNNLPTVSADTSAMTVERTYTSDKISTESFAAQDIVLIVVDEDGTLVQITKANGMPGGGTAPGMGNGGMPSGGMSAGGGMSGMAGGMGQTQAFELYSLDKLTIASVTSQEHMTLAVTVDELDISKIYIGQAATVTMDALAGESFSAAVSRISNSGTNEGGNSKFTVELTLEKSGEMLPGMSASASVRLDTAENALCVPAAALAEENGETVLYTSYDSESGVLGSPVAVTIGIADSQYVQILDGISAGDTIYYPYYDTLSGSIAPQPGAMPFG